VECDGRSYHSGATARDRDRLRQLVLENLGWKLHRVWSTDWWTDHNREIEKLHRILEAALQAPTAEASESPPETLTTSETPNLQLQGAKQPVDDSPHVATRSLPIFRQVAVTTVDHGDFYSDGSSARIASQIRTIVDGEGPISEEALFRQIARAWGLERTGTRIVERLQKLSPREIKTTKTRRSRFYWPTNLDPDQWLGFRSCDGSESSRRHIEDLCAQEIANLAGFILDQAGSTTLEDLAKTICKTVGMARVTADSEKHALVGITHLAKTGRAIIEEERIVLKK